ncbi:hypothetical protein C6361_07790 [Plantactinospora sp. BC1]|nr:hypothetical protein C6361_07790 [Plantactinospora sp. BC1]
MLLDLMGPHEIAYDQMTGALQRLGELSQGAATQVNRAQRSYTSTDEAAAGRLDRTYPGAKNAAEVFGLLSQGRPDLLPTRSAFATVAEPADHLVPPEYASPIEMFKINPLSDLISPAAWLRQVSVWLFDHDPFEGWGQFFSGDWDAYVHCGAAWSKIGNAAFAIGRNLSAGAADVSTVWRGNAAEAEQEFQLALARAAMALEPVCNQYADLYRQAAEAAKNLFSAVTGLISKLLDTLIIINAAAIVGTAAIETGIGPVIGYSVAAYYAWQAYDLYKEISTLYGNAEAIIKAVAGSISAVKAQLDVAGIPSLAPYHHPAVS